MPYAATRLASLAAAGLALSICVAFAQNTVASADFVAGPSNPSPAYPAELLSTISDTHQLPPIPMPQDRALDSYRIYSLLMPVGELGQAGRPRDLWLLADTTIALIPDDQTCMPQGSSTTMNPHVAIQAPTERTQDFAELLDDFDRRCHERVHLTPESFSVVVPLRLLSPAEEDDFVRTRFDPNAGEDGDLLTARYKGAPGLSSFSQVYFNAHHTLAMVYASSWCGGLCTQSYWQVLEYQDGAWKVLPWRSAMISS